MHDCELSCADGVCPGGLSCLGDGLCHIAGSTVCGTAPGDATMASCLGSGGLYLACNVVPDGPLMPPSGVTTLDTDQCPQLVPGQPSVCVFAFSSIDIQLTGTVRVVGAVPAVLVSTSTISVTGAIDASSYVGNTQTGAGADAGCSMHGGVGGADTGAGGGAGGSFQGIGGIGGGGATVGDNGSAAQAMLLTAIRGGCSGGDGGGNLSGGAGGRAGVAGGAVYLIAATDLTISGTIATTGGGGEPGASMASGGGGGGSGGLIGLAAQMITVAISGAVTATAGGGGGGAGDNMPGGAPGGDGIAGGLGGNGGAGAVPGGKGGNGAQATPLAGTPGIGEGGGAGGGGGGGGAGYIYVHSVMPATLSGALSPDPTID